MVEAKKTTRIKKPETGTLSEEDVCSILQRYPAAAILGVLGEIAQNAEIGLNWEALFNKTSVSCGIKSARDLQLLWRHLAYRHPLNLPDNPQYNYDYDYDDDSDLEFQLEPYPPEVSSEAANCVKVLAACSAPDLPAPAPSLSNVPEVVPIVPSPHPQLVVANAGSRKKRKWTDEDDAKLIAAVRKWGEGNWTDILSESPWGRTPYQLSQRWANMRKKQGNVNVVASVSTGPHLSESQLATRRAIDMALKDTTVGNGAAGTSNLAKPKTSNEEPTVPVIAAPAKKQVAVKAAPGSSVPKPRGGAKKAPPKPSSFSDSIQAAAVAAGARIVSPSDVETLHNYSNVHYFRTSMGKQANKDNTVKPSQPAAAVSQLPKPRTIPAVSSSASPIDPLLKKDKTCTQTNVPCSETKQMVRVQEKNASVLRCLSNAPPVKTPGVTSGLTKQTDAHGNSHCAISKGNTDNESIGETSKQVVVGPVLVDVTDNLPANQGSCTPSLNAKMGSSREA